MDVKAKTQASVDKLGAQLDDWDNELKKLKSRAEKAGAETKADYEREVAVVHDKMEVAKQKLKGLRTAGDTTATEDMKQGLEKAWAEVANAFESAKAKFK